MTRTSVKCHRLGEDDRPVERDEHGLLVRGAADLLLQGVTQPDARSEVRHLVEVRAGLLVHLRSEGRAGVTRGSLNRELLTLRMQASPTGTWCFTICPRARWRST